MADSYTAPIASDAADPRTLPDSSTSVLDPATRESVESSIHHAADLIRDALDLTSHAVEKTVELASDKAFESAANVGANIASPPAAQQAAQSAFSWGGYFQALGILCLLLALLWFAVWAIRKYGRFNFLPKPGSLPKNSLVMETQMPLGPKKGLMVVKFFNRRLLLGITEHQITLLTEEPAPNERPEKNFESYFEADNTPTGSGKSDSAA